MTVLLIPTDSNNQEALISFHFGKAKYFAVYDTLKKQLAFIKNDVDHTNAEKSAILQLIEKTKAQVILAGQIGKKAKNECKKIRCEVKENNNGSIKEIIENYEKN